MVGTLVGIGVAHANNIDSGYSSRRASGFYVRYFVEVTTDGCTVLEVETVLVVVAVFVVVTVIVGVGMFRHEQALEIAVVA